MSAFLGTVTNQVIANCKAYIIMGGKLWEQPMPQLLASFELVRQLHTAYLQAFRYPSQALL